MKRREETLYGSQSPRNGTHHQRNREFDFHLARGLRLTLLLNRPLRNETVRLELRQDVRDGGAAAVHVLRRRDADKHIGELAMCHARPRFAHWVTIWPCLWRENTYQRAQHVARVDWQRSHALVHLVAKGEAQFLRHRARRDNCVFLRGVENVRPELLRGASDESTARGREGGRERERERERRA